MPLDSTICTGMSGNGSRIPGIRTTREIHQWTEPCGRTAMARVMLFAVDPSGALPLCCAQVTGTGHCHPLATMGSVSELRGTFRDEGPPPRPIRQSRKRLSKVPDMEGTAWHSAVPV